MKRIAPARTAASFLLTLAWAGVALGAAASDSPQLAYDAGRFAEAAEGWSRAADLHQHAGDLKATAEDLASLASAEESLGNYPGAVAALRRAAALTPPDRAASLDVALAQALRAGALGRHGNEPAP